MFLDIITVNDLLPMLYPTRRQPAWPGLDDPAVRHRAQQHARRLGLWDSLPAGLVQQGLEWAGHMGGWKTPPRPFDARTIPAFRHSDVLHDRDSGMSERQGQAFRYRYYSMSAMATALWLDHPLADIDFLQDVMWAWCETTSWTDGGVDLLSTALASDMAEFLYLFGERMDEAVTTRVATTIEERVLQPARDYRVNNWWSTCRHNWNLVVNSHLISAALYLIDDPATLARYLHPVIENLHYGLDGFTDDGGCTEGVGYWWYGFEHFLDASIMLKHRTSGGVDLVGQHAKIERISRYPLAAHIDGPVLACWADADHGLIPARVIFKINRYFHLPELFGLCRRNANGELLADDADNYRIWRTLTLYHAVEPMAGAELGDAILPDLGHAKVYAPNAPTRTALAALAGHNGVNHNHNDIGSFIYYTRGACMLTDPGAPAYTATSFGARRYENLYNNSFGHSVPVINAKGQSPGADHYGILQVQGLGGDGEKVISIDMTHAYDDETLESLRRELTLLPDGTLTLVDRFRFTRAPESLQETFITYEQATLADDGDSVILICAAGQIRLRAHLTAGRFDVHRLEEESKGGRGQGIISRITFVPTLLSHELEIAFILASGDPAGV